ncbi:hypothetical protein BD289DRAFT_236118 [Coniella lustricola]|uniref:WAP domain-containing protein n=1 Tax=Coniella lustricola TaxID=2025994 RepID=A0A2T3A9N1_9PEZI|nr:hypothetical protein BD289DRAFT_236118 [Coniella lustricola]
MRLLSCAAALVLLTGRVFAQLDMYGLMEDPAQQFWQSGVARPPFLARRDGDCGTGKHPCSDINSTLCCPNTQYCIVSETDFTAQCCDVGSNCGNPCSASMYLTSKLTTITKLGRRFGLVSDYASPGRRRCNTMDIFLMHACTHLPARSYV